MDLSSLPGFRDFFPEEAARRNYIFSSWRQTAERYGFLPYDAPPLETTDLYRRKSGDEIVGQLYCFTDKGDRDISLRPEMTPSLARMVASKGQSLPKPIKWYSIPQLFRYERQQRGRLREHFQLNCDILGEATASADAELIALLVDSLRALKLTSTDFWVRISDRQLFAALIQAIGVKEEKQIQTIFASVDKISREPQDRIKARMVEGGVSTEHAMKVLDLFKGKKLSDIAAEYDSSPEVCARIIHLQNVFAILDSMELKDFIVFDLSIVRGLAYYTGIVFEAFDRKGELRAIAGGGRYDNLVKTIGGVDMPALGFGMGDVVLGELLTERQLWPAKLLYGVDVYLLLVDEKLRPSLLSLAHQLRDAGIKVDYPFGESAMGKQFKAASNSQARLGVVLGPDEWKRGAVKVKNLETREETEVSVANLQAYLLESLKK